MFWDYIGYIASITGIVSFIPLIIAATKYITYDRRRRKERLYALKNAGNRVSVALVVSLGKSSIQTDVKKFIINDEVLKEEFKELVNNPEKEKCSGVIELNNPNPMPENTEGAIRYIEEVINKYRVLEKNMKDNGVDVIHLFYCGPSIVLAPLAAELSNRFKVICYHKDRNKGYYSVGKMQIW